MGRAGVWLLAMLWVVCFVFWRFQGGFVSGFLFYAVTVLALYEASVWLMGGTGWTVAAEVEKAAWVRGDAMDVRLRIRRRFPMPFVWVQAEPVLSRRLWRAYRPQTMFRLLWFARRFDMTYRLSPLPRGKFVLPAVELTCGDLFGLVNRRRLYPQELEVIVYPRWRPLRLWHLGDGHDPERPAATHRRPMRTDETTLTGVRDWQPGDRLSQIHWKASARAAGLKTKRSEFGVSGPVLLLLDLHRESYPATDLSLLERGIELALSLAQDALTRGLAVGLWAEGRERVKIEAKADGRQLQRLAYALAQIDADGERPLAALLRSPAWPEGSKAGLVIITPKLDPALAEAVRGRLKTRRSTAVHVYWLTDGRRKSGHPVQAALRRLGVSVYPVGDVERTAVFGSVPGKGGGAGGAP